MLTRENPGRFIRVEDAELVAQAERVSPTAVQLELTDVAVTATVQMGESAGRALLGGLARLYGYELVETGL